MPPKKEGNNNNSTAGSGKLTKEEERLLLESSRQVTRTTSALFYGNAFIVSALPLCKLRINYLKAISVILCESMRTVYCTQLCWFVGVFCLLCRAVLACSDDGSCDVLPSLCCPDHSQHVAGGLLVQKHQSQSQTQVHNITFVTPVCSRQTCKVLTIGMCEKLLRAPLKFSTCTCSLPPYPQW